jgi:hypothetical protein
VTFKQQCPVITKDSLLLSKNARNAEPLRRYKNEQRGTQTYFSISNLLKTTMTISLKSTINSVRYIRLELKLIIVENVLRNIRYDNLIFPVRCPI